MLWWTKLAITARDILHRRIDVLNKLHVVILKRKIVTLGIYREIGVGVFLLRFLRKVVLDIRNDPL